MGWADARELKRAGLSHAQVSVLRRRGWDVGVAADAELCPLLTLGLVKRYLDGVAEEAQTNEAF